MASTPTPQDSSLLTSSQLRDVQGCLRRPLTGRQVLLPLGPQAFTAGSLQPSVDPETGEEQVALVVNGARTLVQRRTAMNEIQKEIDARQPKPKKPIQKVLAKKSSNQKQSQPAAAAAGPMFEIREELNDDGNEIKSEAINVTQQVKEWEKQVRQAKQNEDDDVDNDGQSKEPYTNMDNTLDDDDDDDFETIVEDTTPRGPAITETEYESLLTRLDELAKLEEESEATESKASTPKLQALRNPKSKPKKSGWTKGFLNASSYNKKTTKKASPKTNSLPSNAEGGTSQFTPTAIPPQSTTPVVMAAKQTPAVEPSDNQQSSKRVGFSNDTQVQEIPRVGTCSVNEIQRPVPTPPQRQDALFAGSVLERPKKSRATRKGQTPAAATASPPEKRLSRFALQRQGLS